MTSASYFCVEIWLWERSRREQRNGDTAANNHKLQPEKGLGACPWQGLSWHTFEAEVRWNCKQKDYPLCLDNPISEEIRLCTLSVNGKDDLNPPSVPLSIGNNIHVSSTTWLDSFREITLVISVTGKENVTIKFWDMVHLFRLGSFWKWSVFKWTTGLSQVFKPQLVGRANQRSATYFRRVLSCFLTTVITKRLTSIYFTACILCHPMLSRSDLLSVDMKINCFSWSIVLFQSRYSFLKLLCFLNLIINFPVLWFRAFRSVNQTLEIFFRLITWGAGWIFSLILMPKGISVHFLFTQGKKHLLHVRAIKVINQIFSIWLLNSSSNHLLRKKLKVYQYDKMLGGQLKYFGIMYRIWPPFSRLLWNNWRTRWKESMCRDQETDTVFLSCYSIHFYSFGYFANDFIFLTIMQLFFSSFGHNFNKVIYNQ